MKMETGKTKRAAVIDYVVCEVEWARGEMDGE